MEKYVSVKTFEEEELYLSVRVFSYNILALWTLKEHSKYKIMYRSNRSFNIRPPGGVWKNRKPESGIGTGMGTGTGTGTGNSNGTETAM